MTEPATDKWHTRDLIALRACVELMDEANDLVELHTIAERSGLSIDEAKRAVLALERDGLVRTLNTRDGSGIRVYGIKNVSGEAYRKVGAWPTPDSMADKLLSALEDLAESSDDPLTKTRARKALDGLGGFSRDVLVSVVGAAAGTAMQ